jgi:hypothetical protein
LRPQCRSTSCCLCPSLIPPHTCKHISNGQIAHAVHNMHPVFACCRLT